MIQLVKRVGLRYDQTNFLSKNNFKGKLECDSAQLNLLNYKMFVNKSKTFVGDSLVIA